MLKIDVNKIPKSNLYKIILRIFIISCICFCSIVQTYFYLVYVKVKELELALFILTTIMTYIVSGFVIFIIIKNKESTFEIDIKNKGNIVLFVIIMIAILLRCILFTFVPKGLNQDEASMIYESYSLLNYGIDRTGYTWPVYLEAWGSGQNALLTYLSIPFVAIFGMNIFSARIVSLICSLFALIVLYLIIKRIANEKLALITMLLFAILPWNVMASRWGLESNLLPYFLLFGFYFLVKAIKDNHWFLCLSCLFWGLALYSYAISYMFLPIFIVIVYIYMFFKKKINYKSFIVANLILLALALPLMLFLAVNNGLIKEFKIFGIFSVPKLGGYRGGEIKFSTYNLGKLFRTVFLQNDFWNHNNINGIGSMFLFSTPMLIFGITKSIKNIKDNKSKEFNFDVLFIIWFIISLILGCTMYSNVNKINIIWIPIYYFIALGLHSLIRYSKIIFITICSFFVISLSMFIVLYYDTERNNSMAYSYNYGLIEASAFAESKENVNTKVFLAVPLNEREYIYTVIGTKESSVVFSNTVKYVNENVDFRTVISYGNYYFIYDKLEFNKDNIIIVKDDVDIDIPTEYSSKRFGYFTVYYIE